jgi:IclR family pca regulon transcriptional regulator
MNESTGSHRKSLSLFGFPVKKSSLAEDPKAVVTFGPVGKKTVPSAVPLREEVGGRASPPEDAAPLASQMDEFRGDPDFMTSLARGLLVIRAFSQRPPRLSISHLSKRTGLSRASVRRCLHTLSKLGFAGSEDGRHFYLRPRILTLGYSYLSSMPLATAAQPVLDQLSQILHESCSLALLDGADIVFMAHAKVARTMTNGLGVGSRLPAFCTSKGRVLLANLSPEELEGVLRTIEFTRYTDRTVTSVEGLRQILMSVRAEGYAIIDQELELGLRSMAVPVRNSAGQVFAAISVGANGQRVSVQDMQTRFLPYLRAAAQELSLLLC